MAANICPHNCARCRTLEAGVPAGRALTPSEFVEIFGVVEQPQLNGAAPETVEARAALRVAEIAFDRAHDEVGELVAQSKQRRDDPDFEDALIVATEDRAAAGDALVSARVRYHDLAKADEQSRLREEYEAGQAAQEQVRAERDATRRDAGRGLLSKLRGKA